MYYRRRAEITLPESLPILLFRGAEIIIRKGAQITLRNIGLHPVDKPHFLYMNSQISPGYFLPFLIVLEFPS